MDYRVYLSVSSNLFSLDPSESRISKSLTTYLKFSISVSINTFYILLVHSDGFSDIRVSCAEGRFIPA